MPISVRYALRSPKKNQSYSTPHPLEIWITVNGKRAHFGAVWPVHTGAKLQVNPADWSVKKQTSTRRDDQVKGKLTALKAHVEAIFDRQHLVAVPTLESVVFELTEQRSPVFSLGAWQLSSDPKEHAGEITAESGLLSVYAKFVADEKNRRGGSEKRADRAAVTRWERGYFLLEEWERKMNKKVPTCARVTLSWLRDYHTWLVGQPSGKQKNPISAPQASRYVGKIGRILQWMVDDDLLTHNSVKKTSWPRYNDKEILFLEPEHVAHLFQLEWTGTAGVSVWWFLLMCCTGLDYPDTKAYVANRASLEKVGSAGPKLYGRRFKWPYELYDVPLLDEVELLFSRFPKGPKVVTPQCLNRHTEDIQTELGIEWRITNKTARKTFGCLMLINGFSVPEVSRMLGHKRISTTEKHYVKFVPSGVDRARLRVGKNSLL